MDRGFRWEINQHTKRCMLCDKKIVKNDLAFIHASSAYHHRVQSRSVCEECQIEIIYNATGSKYLRPKVIKEIQLRIVAKKV